MSEKATPSEVELLHFARWDGHIRHCYVCLPQGCKGNGQDQHRAEPTRCRRIRVLHQYTKVNSSCCQHACRTLSNHPLLQLQPGAAAYKNMSWLAIAAPS